jgi:iron complex transport system substrate-binding protein
MAPRATRLLLPLLIVAVLLAACQAGASSTGHPSPGVSAPLATASPMPPTATTYPVTLTDDAGHEVTIESDPRRIVSLAPSNTEIACAVGACDELVGVTDIDDYPARVADVTKVVVGAQVDVEKVVAAEPDLVLAGGNGITPDAILAQLGELGLTVLVLYPRTVGEIGDDVALVGQAVDENAAAAAEVARIGDAVTQVTAAVAGADRPRVFYEVGVFEGQIYTAGASSFLASLIDLAGAEAVTGDATTTSIALEDLVAADPQVILLGDAAYDPTITADTVAARPGWGGMTAVTDGRILPMPEDIVITRPGPRVTEGLAALARALHPDRFGS